MNIAIILSGGIGTRMGANIPKQYIEVDGRPIISYSMEKFLDHDGIGYVIIALNDEWRQYVEDHMPPTSKKIYFSEPGDTRELTIYNALRKAKETGASDDDVVIIHDAVRPLVSKEVIDRCLDGCVRYDASIATIDVKDTIYVSQDGGDCITFVPDRSNLHAGQTPEAFRLGKYLKIHDDASDEEIRKVTGGAQFAQQQGLSVFIAKGAEINFKITTPEDLQRFVQVISDRQKG